MLQKFSTTPSISTRAADFRKSLSGVGRVQGKLSDVIQQHLDVAFEQAELHSNLSLLSICFIECDKMSGINAGRIKTYITAHIGNLKWVKGSNSFAKDVKGEAFEFTTRSESWYSFTKAKANKDEPTIEEQEERIAKYLMKELKTFSETDLVRIISKAKAMKAAKKLSAKKVA